MKLTLQLVVVVLVAPTTFRDNLFKFTLNTEKFSWLGRVAFVPSEQ